MFRTTHVKRHAPFSNFIGSIFNRFMPWSDYAKIQQLSDFQQHERQRLEQFSHQFNATLAIEQGLLTLADQNARSIRDLKKQLLFFREMSSELTWLVPMLQTRISLATADLKTMYQEASRGRVATHELADFVNCTELHQVDPQDTRLLSITRLSDNTIRFHFYADHHSQDTHVYRIHAFRYWANLTGLPELREYQGSSYVVYNKTSNCIRGIERPAERTIMERCSTPNFVDPKIRVWRTLLATYDIQSQDLTQALKTPFNNYVYCLGFNVTLGHQTVPCPLDVFRLLPSQPFSTSNYSHEYNSRIRYGILSNRYLDSIQLAHFDDPSIATTDVTLFHKVQQIQDNLRRAREEEHEWRIVKQGPATWTLACLMAFLCITVVSLLAYINWILQKNHRKLTSRHHELKTELNDLSTTYQKMDCGNSSKVIQELRAANQALSASSSMASTSAEPVEVGRNESINVHFHTGSTVAQPPLPPKA